MAWQHGGLRSWLAISGTPCFVFVGVFLGVRECAPPHRSRPCEKPSFGALTDAPQLPPFARPFDLFFELQPTPLARQSFLQRVTGWSTLRMILRHGAHGARCRTSGVAAGLGLASNLHGFFPNRRDQYTEASVYRGVFCCKDIRVGPLAKAANVFFRYFLWYRKPGPGLLFIRDK